MIKLICDKCGRECSEYSCYKHWSDSQCKEVLLCRKCDGEYQEVLFKADADFFAKEGDN